MRALLIAHHFWQGAAEDSRWAQLCAESTAMGLEWDVITRVQKVERGGSSADQPGVRLHLTPAARGWPKPLAGLRRWHDGWRRPDATADWVPAAVARAKIVIASAGLGPGRFDAVVSSGAPVSAHVAGRAVARWAGVPWIADWNEPWGVDPGSSRANWVRRADRQLERELVRGADGLIVTTDALAEVYRHDRIGIGNDGYDGDAVAVIRAGFDPSQMARASRLPLGRRTQRSRTRIVCTGDLSAHGRNLNEMLEAFAMNPRVADRLELVFIGPGDQAPYQRRLRPLGLRENVVFLGDLSKPEVLSLQLSADALLSFGFDSPYRINPRIAEYAACDRPVLHVRCSGRDPSLELLGCLGRVLVCDSNRFSILHALERAIRDHWDGSGQTRLEALRWPALAERLSVWLEGRVAVSRVRVARRSVRPGPSVTALSSGQRSSGD